MEQSRKYSYYDEDSSISILIPEGWQPGKHEAFDFMVLGPVVDGYKSNVGFTVKEIGPLMPESVDKIIENTRKDQHAHYHQFKEVKAEKRMINQHPVWMQFYRWKDENLEREFSQVLMLAVLEEDLLLEVNASTLYHLESKILPVILDIITSFRFI